MALFFLAAKNWRITIVQGGGALMLREASALA